MAEYKGKYRNVMYRLSDAPIGSGGEGSVYEIKGDPTHVAKIYHTDKNDFKTKCNTLQKKLEVMISMPITPEVDGILHLAWPEDILFDKDGRFAGYVMPRAKHKYKIYDIARSDRSKILPKYTFKYSIQYSYNLSWVIWHLHLNNIIVGDMNMNNILVGEKGEIVLIDCDSFDIYDPKTKEHYKCNVGLPELLAPEIQMAMSEDQKVFTKESDNFTLAIHIFRLLMNNADPFAAKTVGHNIPSVNFNDCSNRAIINGESPYFRDIPGLQVPDWAMPLDFLPDDIKNAFRATFNYTQASVMKKKNDRTSAEAWCRLLLKYGEKEPNPNLTSCKKNKRHVYPVHNTSCPFCEMESGKGTGKTRKSALKRLFK
ncbi:MAG: hypothetical protein E7675_04925 [Ruminococcaceae bacterium]|nr:hypothetical protein [Oscillospiraceae bacterium]